MKYFSKKSWLESFGKPFEIHKIQHYIHENSNPKIIEFLEHISTPNAIIFIEWIEQTKSLIEILSTGKGSHFVDEISIVKHALFADFKEFVSPFLLPCLLSIAEEETFSNALEHIVLLDNRSKVIIEEHIHKKTLEHIKQLQYEQLTQNQWKNLLGQTLSDQRVALYNNFSKTSYFLKMDYVEKSIYLLKHHKYTIEIAKWIGTQLLKIEINPNHRDQLQNRLERLFNEILTAKRHEKKTNQLQLLKIIIAIITLLLIVSFTIYLTINT